jgi:hypothetical protein
MAPTRCPKPLQVLGNGAFSPLPATVRRWTGPVSNDAVTITFKQPIAATDPLRTGDYGKSLTLSLSTTQP